MTETRKQAKAPQDESRKDPMNVGTSTAIGMCLGIVIGAATDNLGLWLSLGLCLGAAVGVSLSGKTDSNDSADPPSAAPGSHRDR